MSYSKKIIIYKSLELVEQPEIACRVKKIVGNRVLVELNEPLGPSRISECIFYSRYKWSLFPYWWFGKLIVNTFILEESGNSISGPLKLYDIGEVSR